MFCNQTTTRNEPCSRKASYVVPDRRTGNIEAYCTQHANYYGVKRRKGWARVRVFDSAEGSPTPLSRAEVAAAVEQLKRHEQIRTDGCPGCGVASGELHRDGCRFA